MYLYTFERVWGTGNPRYFGGAQNMTLAAKESEPKLGKFEFIFMFNDLGFAVFNKDNVYLVKEVQ